MGKPGSELLFYILIIAGFLLFNYLAQQAARKAREQQEAAEREAAEREAAQAPEPLAEEDLEDIWGRPSAPLPPPPVLAPPPVRAAPAVAPPPSAPARAPLAATLFRQRNDLRRAIVAMAVLGPCRAEEPFERR